MYGLETYKKLTIKTINKVIKTTKIMFDQQKEYNVQSQTKCCTEYILGKTN